MVRDMVCGFNHVFCRSISVTAYDVFNVTALANVTDDFVDSVLVRIILMWLVCRLSRSCFVRVFVGSLFRLVRFLVMAAISLKRRCIRYPVYKACIQDTVLAHGHGTGAHF